MNTQYKIDHIQFVGKIGLYNPEGDGMANGGGDFARDRPLPGNINGPARNPHNPNIPG